MASNISPMMIAIRRAFDEAAANGEPAPRNKDLCERLGLNKNQIAGAVYRLRARGLLPEAQGWRVEAWQRRREKQSAERVVRRRETIKVGLPRVTPSPFRTCQYIQGEVPKGGDPVAIDAAKCGKPTVVGRSYCPKHLARCIASVTSMEEAVRACE